MIQIRWAIWGNFSRVAAWRHDFRNICQPCPQHGRTDYLNTDIANRLSQNTIGQQQRVYFFEQRRCDVSGNLASSTYVMTYLLTL